MFLSPTCVETLGHISGVVWWRLPNEFVVVTYPRYQRHRYEDKLVMRQSAVEEDCELGVPL